MKYIDLIDLAQDRERLQAVLDALTILRAP
jgi:hypothetical protein